MQYLKHPRISLLLVAVGLLLLGGGWATACEDAPAEEPAKTEAMPPVPFASGMKIVVDPETGRLRAPTAAESRLLDALGNDALTYKSTEGLRSVVAPDGTISLNLQGRYLKAAVAEIGEDGDLDVQHDAVPVHTVDLPIDDATEAWWHEGDSREDDEEDDQ